MSDSAPTDTPSENPLARMLRLFREIDRDSALETELGKPVTRYDLTEAMLVLANMQMAQLNLSLASRRSDKESLKTYMEDFTAQLAAVVEVAARAGGSEFGKKVLSSFGDKSDG